MQCRYRVKINNNPDLFFNNWQDMVIFLRAEVVRLNDRNAGLDFDLIMDHGISKILSYTHMIFGFTRIEINEEIPSGH